jgi:hypothetical protein
MIENMRSLKRVFNKMRGENPFWSDYNCFAEAVIGRRFSRKTITRNLLAQPNIEKEGLGG